MAQIARDTENPPNIQVFPGEESAFARAGIDHESFQGWITANWNAHQALEAAKSGKSLSDLGDAKSLSPSGLGTPRDLTLIRQHLLVSTGEIAALAGKSVSAVSQWRRGTRRPFPEPVVGGRSPQFPLDEVQAWLEQLQPGDVPTRAVPASWFWRKAVQALHHSAKPAERSRLRSYIAAMTVVLPDFVNDVSGFVEGLALGAADGLDEWKAGTGRRLEKDLSDFVHDQIRSANPDREILRCAARAFRYALNCGFTEVGLLDEGLEALTELSPTRTTTALPVSNLIAGLARDMPGLGGSVMDLACGEATLLTHLLIQGRNHKLTLSGVEIQPDTAAIAQIRLLLQAPKVKWSVQVGDSLAEQRRAKRYDIVVVDPPTKKLGAWVRLARSHLRADDTARAFVLLPIETMKAGGPCAELIKQGRLEAVVRLPSRLKRETRGDLALCMFTSDEVTCNEILFIDVSDLKLRNLGHGSAPSTTNQTGKNLPTSEICDAVSHWRNKHQINDGLLPGRQRAIAVDGSARRVFAQIASGGLPQLEEFLGALTGGAAPRPRTSRTSRTPRTPLCQTWDGVFVVPGESTLYIQYLVAELFLKRPVVIELEGAGQVEPDTSVGIAIKVHERRRLWDVVSAISTGAGYQMEVVANQWIVLTPPNIEVTDDDRRHLKVAYDRAIMADPPVAESKPDDSDAQYGTAG